MICPKCENGLLIKIQFRSTGERAYLCEVCDVLWFEHEHIAANSAHTFAEYSQEHDIDYAIDEFNEIDLDHQAL